jgi:hypothetical protein
MRRNGEIMNKSYVSAAPVLTCLLGVGVSARAQDADEVVGSVPFEFVAGGAVLPPGEYRASRIDPGGNRELAINCYNKGNAYLLPPSFNDDSAKEPALSFCGVEFYMV